MDVHIGEVTSSVQAVDSEAWMNPDVMRQIVQQVLAELRRQEMQQDRRQRDTRLQQGSYSSGERRD